jgi:hypothetical protein
VSQGGKIQDLCALSSANEYDYGGDDTVFRLLSVMEILSSLSEFHASGSDECGTGLGIFASVAAELLVGVWGGLVCMVKAGVWRLLTMRRVAVV